MRSFTLPLLLLSLPAPVAVSATCEECAPAATLDTVYTAELWSSLSGGAATGNRYLDNLDITVDVDAGQAWGLEGLQIFGYVLYNNGHSISELTSTAQGTSNIESTRALRLYELWTQWQFGSDSTSLRFGLYDLNSEFDSIETAALFVNPSHGIGAELAQSGANGPSIFPTTSLALRAQRTLESWTFQVAALDGVPGDLDHPDQSYVHLSSSEGALLIGEINYRSATGARLAAGYWQYTADFSSVLDAAERQRDDNAGFYALAETPVFFSQGSDRGARMFVRAGAAEEHINPIGRYYGLGGVYTGANARRPTDQIGLAIAIAELGRPFMEAQQLEGSVLARREYNCELTYRAAINDWLAVQTDLQYVRNPGMDPDMDASWAIGLRLEVGRNWQW